MLLERRDNAEIERRFDEAECSFQLDGLKLYVVSEKARVAFKSRVIARVEENEKLQEDLELYLKEFIKDPSDKDAEIVDLDEFRKRASGEKN